MHKAYYVLCLLALVAACAMARSAHARASQQAEQPVLNVFAYSQPRERAQVGEQIDYQADIYSTSDVTETLTLTATIEPYVPFEAAAIIQWDKLGESDCKPTLMYLACTIPIKRMHSVSIVGSIDAPNFGWCLPGARFHVVASLPDRLTIADHTVAIDNGLSCTYLPIMSVNNGS